MDALTFRVADGEYAIDLRRVQEVSMGVPVTRVPGAPAAVRGVSNLRGNVVPMIDLSLRLAGPGVVGTGRAAVLFVHARLGAEMAVVGLMVDAVRTVVAVAEGEIVERSTVPALAGAEVMSGLARVGKDLVPILDVDALVSLEGLASSRGWSSPEAWAAAGERAARDAQATERVEAAPVPEPAWPARTPEPAGASPPEPVAEGPRPVAPAGTGPPATPAAAVAARPPPASVPRQPPPVPPPLPARRRGSAPEVGSSEARGWKPEEARAEAIAPPEAGPRRGESLSSGSSTGLERRGAGPAWWVWLVGAAAAALAVVLVALLFGRSGPSPVDRKRGTATSSSMGSGPAAPMAARGSPEAPERLEVLRPASPRPAAPGAPGEVSHEVRPGDTLWHLSARYYGDPHRWPEIWSANRALVRDPDLILPEERLRIPAPPGPPGGERR